MSRKWQGVLLVCALVNVSAVSAEGPRLNRVMRNKLAISQRILEAVVTSDWVSLEAKSRELEALTNGPAWTVLNAAEYAQHHILFKEAVGALHEAAARRDLEAAPKAYVAMTLSCVQCHRFLARNRLARE